MAELEGTSASLEPAALGGRIREHRLHRRLTLRRLAELCGTSPGHLSDVERGHSGASIAMLRRIASPLGLTLADLFDGRPTSSGRLLLRRDRPDISASDGVRKFLISQKPIQSMEVYVAELDPQGSTGPSQYTHGDSVELLLINKGKIRCDLYESSYYMEAGDSLEYRTSVPHRATNVGPEVAEVTWIVAPPSIERFLAQPPQDEHQRDPPEELTIRSIPSNLRECEER